MKVRVEEDDAVATVEIKNRQYLHAGDAAKIIAKGTVIGLVTSGKISQPAKDLFDENNIAWKEYYEIEKEKEKESRLRTWLRNLFGRE